MYNPEEHALARFVSKPLFDPDLIKKKNKGYPKLSIVMPSYNQGQFIERSILSVLNQNYPNTELIVIDGDSDDETIDILKRYDEFITFWVSEPDQGQSDALNKGFSNVTGDIYGWLNSDDLYSPNIFYEVIEVFEKSNKKLLYGDWNIINEEDIIIRKKIAFPFSINQLIYEGFHFNVQSMFWKKEVHDNFGKFDVCLHKTMDYEMMLRFGKILDVNSDIKFIPKVLGNFRYHKDRKTQFYDNETKKEQKYISKKWNTNRYHPVFKYLEYVYKIRRIYWYIRRLGLKFTFNRIRK